jgi:anti-anti-sigma factor
MVGLGMFEVTASAVAAGEISVAVAGECDLSVSDQLMTALRDAIREVPVVIVDVAGLRFLDSSGVHVLVMANRAARVAGRHLYVTNASGAVSQVLDVTGVGGLLTRPDHGKGFGADLADNRSTHSCPPGGSDGVAGTESIEYMVAGDLSVVRGFVRSYGSAAGMPADRLDVLALAVNELATNTLQHTSGGGRLRVWIDGEELVCEVVDQGPARPFGPMPEPESPRGRGLALISQLVDEVTTEQGPDGTVVRLRLGIKDPVRR